MKIVARSKWKHAPGVFVAARKSELGGLWPYLDNHDFKDHTGAKAEAAAAANNNANGNGSAGLGLGPAEDGDDENEDWGSEGWEPVVEESKEHRGGRQARGGRAEMRRRRRDARAERAAFN